MCNFSLIYQVFMTYPSIPLWSLHEYIHVSHPLLVRDNMSLTEYKYPLWVRELLTIFEHVQGGAVLRTSALTQIGAVLQNYHKGKGLLYLNLLCHSPYSTSSKIIFIMSRKNRVEEHWPP